MLQNISKKFLTGLTGSLMLLTTAMTSYTNHNLAASLDLNFKEVGITAAANLNILYNPGSRHKHYVGLWSKLGFAIHKYNSSTAYEIFNLCSQNKFNQFLQDKSIPKPKLAEVSVNENFTNAMTKLGRFIPRLGLSYTYSCRLSRPTPTTRLYFEAGTKFDVLQSIIYYMKTKDISPAILLARKIHGAISDKFAYGIKAQNDTEIHGYAEGKSNKKDEDYIGKAGGNLETTFFVKFIKNRVSNATIQREIIREYDNFYTSYPSLKTNTKFFETSQNLLDAYHFNDENDNSIFKHAFVSHLTELWTIHAGLKGTYRITKEDTDAQNNTPLHFFTKFEVKIKPFWTIALGTIGWEEFKKISFSNYFDIQLSAGAQYLLATEDDSDDDDL